MMDWNNVKWDAGRVEAARVDGRDFASGLTSILVVFLGGWSIVLFGMAYIGIHTAWIVATGVLAVCTTLGGLVIAGLHRLDVGRAYIEKTCFEIESLINDKK